MLVRRSSSVGGNPRPMELSGDNSEDNKKEGGGNTALFGLFSRTKPN